MCRKQLAYLGGISPSTRQRSSAPLTHGCENVCTHFHKQRECFSLHSCSRAKKKRLSLNGIISFSSFWYFCKIPLRNLCKKKDSELLHCPCKNYTIYFLIIGIWFIIIETQNAKRKTIADITGTDAIALNDRVLKCNTEDSFSIKNA